jgi:hypothetical protein
LLALAALPSAPAGDSVPIRVEFDAPAGCSSVDAFYAGLLARTSHARRATPGEEGMRLAVRLTRAGTKVRGELRLMDGPGDGDTRRVEGETCDAVVEVLSLTAALALAAQPTIAAPPPPPPPPPPPRVTTPPRSSSSSSPTTTAPKLPEPAPEAPKPPEPPKPPEAEQPPAITITPPKLPEPLRHTSFEFGLQAVAADVIAGSFSFGGGLVTRFQRYTTDGRSASVGLTFLYVQNDLVQSANDVGVRWMAASATGCPWGLGRTVWVQPCAQAIGGWLSATGLGLTNPSSAGRTWWSAGALLRLGVDLGAGFSLELDAGASVPLVGHRFITTTPERTVGETPTISPMVALGLSRSL